MSGEKPRNVDYVLREAGLPRPLVPDFVIEALDKLVKHGETETADRLAKGYASLLRYLEALEETCYGAAAEPESRPFMKPGGERPVLPPMPPT